MRRDNRSARSGRCCLPPGLQQCAAAPAIASWVQACPHWQAETAARDVVHPKNALRLPGRVNRLFPIRFPQVSVSLDRGAREKEMAAQLLSAAYPDCVQAQNMAKGFLRLLEGAVTTPMSPRR